MKVSREVPSIYRKDGSMKEISTGNSSLRNYKRVFLNQAIPVLGMNANRQTQIILYLLGNADSNNMIYCTYKDIMEDCQISDKKVVAKVLKDLQQTETIVNVSQSHYMLNPAVMMQGDNQKFGLLASTFNSIVEENKRNNKKKTEDK